MRKLLCFAAGAACVFALMGCSSQATFTEGLGSAYAELKGLEGTVEDDFSLPYTDAALDIELEKGTVDVEIVDIDVFESDDVDDYVELDTICEATGLKSGDRVTFTDDDGEILLRITSDDGATGTLTFNEG